MTGPYSLRLRASWLDGGAHTYYPSSPLTKESERGREKTDWPLRPPCVTPVGTSRRPWLPGSPSQPCHISPWKTAPTPVPAGIGQLSSPLPFPPSSRAPTGSWLLNFRRVVSELGFQGLLSHFFSFSDLL